MIIKRIPLIGMFLLVCFAILADDSVIFSSGDTLFPIQESEIALRKETLIIRERSDTFEVEVDFEFLNPGEQRTLTVGFISAPYASAGQGILDPPLLRDFTVTVNGERMEHASGFVEDTEFENLKRQYTVPYFIYFFTATFLPGKNLISQRFTYKGGGDSIGGRDLLYRLTTGTSWAGGKIDVFELQFHPRGNKLIELPLSFEEGLVENLWCLHGLGNLRQEGDRIFCYVKNGYLSYHRDSFAPSRDLTIYIDERWRSLTRHIDLTDLGDTTVVASVIHYLDSPISQPRDLDLILSTLEKQQLRVARNTLFARHGYSFTSPDLRDLFQRFPWYKPDSDIPNSRDILDSREQDAFERIIQAEQTVKEPPFASKDLKAFLEGFRRSVATHDWSVAMEYISEEYVRRQLDGLYEGNLIPFLRSLFGGNANEIVDIIVVDFPTDVQMGFTRSVLNLLVLFGEQRRMKRIQLYIERISDDTGRHFGIYGPYG